MPYGICVLTVTGAGIRRISSFGDQGLVAVFGFRPDRRSLRGLSGEQLFQCLEPV